MLGRPTKDFGKHKTFKSNPKTLKFASEILHREFIDTTMADIQTAGDGKKLCTHKLFKNILRLEHYLLNIPNQHYRCALAQYRLSSHNLGIETGILNHLHHRKIDYVYTVIMAWLTTKYISSQTAQPTQTYTYTHTEPLKYYLMYIVLLLRHSCLHKDKAEKWEVLDINVLNSRIMEQK